jgi:hypothetical protein
MPSSIYELGTYLLQDKYKDKYIQTCHDILMKNNNNKTYPLINLAVIWSYNAINDSTKFTIVLHKSIMNLNLGFNINESITYKGLHKKLILDKNLIV